MASELPDDVGQPIVERECRLEQPQGIEHLRRNDAPPPAIPRRGARPRRDVDHPPAGLLTENQAVPRRQLAESEPRHLVVPFRVGRVQCPDGVRLLCPPLRPVRLPKSRLPQVSRSKWAPCVIQQRHRGAHERQHGLAHGLHHRFARRGVARMDEPRRLTESRPDNRGQRACARGADEILGGDDRILRPQHVRAAADLDVEDIGRQGGVECPEPAVRVRGAVGAHQHVEVQHPVGGDSRAQAGAVEQDGVNGCGVPLPNFRCDLPGGIGRRASQFLSQQVGEGAVGRRCRGGVGHAQARTNRNRRSVERCRMRPGCGAKSSPSMVNPQFIRRLSRSTLRLS